MLKVINIFGASIGLVLLEKETNLPPNYTDLQWESLGQAILIDSFLQDSDFLYWIFKGQKSKHVKF